MKVRMIQGYYFDKPMPRAAFEEKYVDDDKRLANGSKGEKRTNEAESRAGEADRDMTERQKAQSHGNTGHQPRKNGKRTSGNRKK